MPSRWASLTVDGNEMQTYVAVPNSEGPHPSIIVAMHVFGIDKFIQGVCDDLARAGYLAVAPYLHHRQSAATNDELIAIPFEDPRRREIAMPMKDALRDDEIRRDIETTIEFIDQLPAADGTMGITGFCIGGRVAYLMPELSDRFSASAIWYAVEPAISWGNVGRSPIEMSENIGCPVIGFFGDLDTSPTPEEVDQIEEAFKIAGVDYVFHRYPDAQHAFNDPYNPVRWNADATADAWPKCVAFFDSAMGKG